MPPSLIYRSAALYELAMLALYGRHYGARYRAVAELIPDGASVLDLCCGPASLYRRYLRPRRIAYTGLDVNPGFIRRLGARGAEGRVWDVRSAAPLPEADYVIMQASLYHFLPEPRPVVDRMLRSARRQVIIAEPIRNLATSDSRTLSMLGRRFTDPGAGSHALRFTAATLDDLFSSYGPRVLRSFLIAGGREKVYLLG